MTVSRVNYHAFESRANGASKSDDHFLIQLHQMRFRRCRALCLHGASLTSSECHCPLAMTWEYDTCPKRTWTLRIDGLSRTLFNKIRSTHCQLRMSKSKAIIAMPTSVPMGANSKKMIKVETNNDLRTMYPLSHSPRATDRQILTYPKSSDQGMILNLYETDNFECISYQYDIPQPNAPQCNSNIAIKPHNQTSTLASHNHKFPTPGSQLSPILLISSPNLLLVIFLPPRPVGGLCSSGS